MSDETLTETITEDGEIVTVSNVPATVPKTPVVAGGGVMALIPQSIEEAYRVAVAFHKADIAPKDLKSPEKILAVIMGGAELGFAPMQALASFAWINNRLCIYGDAVPALLWTNGIKVREWFENADFEKFPDNMTAWCEITRPDGQVIARSFSVAQAKRANLWNKRGHNGQDTPWITYPDRMLQMRARSWCSRDGAADVLKGRPILEEVQDFGIARDVTPQKSGLMNRLQDRGFKAGNVDAALNETSDVVDAVVEEVSPVADKVAEVVTAMRHAKTRADLEIAKLDGEHIEGANQGERDWLLETYKERLAAIMGASLGGGAVTEINVASMGSDTRLQNVTVGASPQGGVVEDAEFTEDAKVTGTVGATVMHAGLTGEFAESETAEADADPVHDDAPTVEELQDWAASYLRGLSHLTTEADIKASWETPVVKQQAMLLKAVKPALAASLVKAVNDRVAELRKK